jgi:RNA polymerase sigma-70 factor, ECF subfamily
MVIDQRAYLHRAVLNAAHSHHRSRGRREARDRLAAAREHLVSNEMDVQPEVWAAVLTLSAQQRAVIVLTYWYDLAPGQVAERLGIGEGSVKQHLTRARKRLRRLFSDG